MRIKGALLILLTACLGTALAMSTTESEDTDSGVVGAVIKAGGVSANVERKSAELPYDLSAIKRPMPKNIRSAGLFDAKSWYVPSPVQAAPAYVPPPQSLTPTLPFSFIGRMLDGEEVTLFLSRNDRQYTVKEKDMLDDTYRVDKIGESEAVLTYLPSNTQQTLLFNTVPIAH